MNTSENVLERKVIPPGKPFIKAGEEHARAYIVQTGLIRAYIEEDGKKIEVQTYGPGRIIGEVCLMSDEPMTMNYEAVESSTVVTLTRSEFQKKIAKMDKNVSTILEHVMNKLNFQYADDINAAKLRSKTDELLSSPEAVHKDAGKLVGALTANLAGARKEKYENAIMPHMNAMLQTIEALKAQEKEEG